MNKQLKTVHPVLQLLMHIPKGKAVTYKEMARIANTSPRGAATVLAHNKDPHQYPCYKVVASNGELRGYSAPGGLAKKYELLKHDGVRFTINGRVDPRDLHTF